jgi:hypothetical protein
MATRTRGRRLLPGFRSNTNVPDLPPGHWTLVEAPTELAKLEVPRDDDGSGFRVRVQSVPSPWARLFVFRDAMLDPNHPARTLVENEILDALELAWASGPQSLRLETQQIQVVSTAQAAEHVSPRAGDYGAALADLAPRAPRREGEMASALPVVTVARVDGRPVFASSPYTVVFTAEDAAAEAYPYLFRYAQGAQPRSLRERPFAFQRYVATVVLPQVQAPVPAPGEYVDTDALRRGVADFLAKAVVECRRAAGPRAPELATPENWREQLRGSGLRQAGAHVFAGVGLYTAQPEQLPSRWTLRPTRPSTQTPIVLVPGHFDGVYGEGLPKVELPAELERLDRAVLPGTGYRRAWALPERDWLADALVILSDPLERENVFGTESYRPDVSVTEPPFAQAQMALPLKGEFFRWFRPEDIARMLIMEVPRPGEVRVTLEVPVGSEQRPEVLRVQRRYTGAQIRQDHVGPQLVVWPTFAVDDWKSYAVFRLDRQAGAVHPAEALQVQAYRNGERLDPLDHTRRTDVAATYAYEYAPEVLELRAESAPGLPQQALGVLVPRYRPVPAPHAEKWRVGVDFGTSNTVVALHREGQQEEVVLKHERVLLSLTRPSADLSFFAQSFFLPDTIEPEPFNTAVVYFTAIRNYHNPQEPVAVNINIPFSGFVKSNDRNRVAADLKWSSSEREEFLAAAFLRTTAALALAHARQDGVAPENVTFAYAYPRAFERDREETLRGRWKGILGPPGTPDEAFVDGGTPTATRTPGEDVEGGTPAAPRIAVPKLATTMDEGRSALRYFLSRQALATTGALSVMLDVGGGTTDLAAYAQSKAVALDSLRWGGRDLTGSRVRQGTRGGFTNPFVRAFAEWALKHGLPPSQQEPLQKYAEEGHDALAFSYLVRTRWYRDGGALLFRETDEHGSFRLLVLYFFAALFHYTGLLQRAVHASGVNEPLAKVILAGNGSRFLEWLQRDWSTTGDNPFRDVLADVLAGGSEKPATGATEKPASDASQQPAGGASEQPAGGQPARVAAPPPSVELSPRPKEEVARGLVTPAGGAAKLQVAANASGSILGERVRIERDNTPARLYESVARFPSHLPADERIVGGIHWEDETMEIERFHAALVKTAREHLTPLGGPWASVAARLERGFNGLPRASLQQATRTRLEALVRATGGVPGSLFMVEAGAMLDHLMTVLFASGGEA